MCTKPAVLVVGYVLQCTGMPMIIANLHSDKCRPPNTCSVPLCIVLLPSICKIIRCVLQGVSGVLLDEPYWSTGAISSALK